MCHTPPPSANLCPFHPCQQCKKEPCPSTFCQQPLLSFSLCNVANVVGKIWFLVVVICIPSIIPETDLVFTFFLLWGPRSFLWVNFLPFLVWFFTLPVKNDNLCLSDMTARSLGGSECSKSFFYGHYSVSLSVPLARAFPCAPGHLPQPTWSGPAYPSLPSAAFHTYPEFHTHLPLGQSYSMVG